MKSRDTNKLNENLEETQSIQTEINESSISISTDSSRNGIVNIKNNA